LATTGATGSTRVDAPRATGLRARVAERNHETKAAFKTTEFWAMIVLVVSILVSAALIKGGDNGTDEFIARHAWLYVSILGAGYFISRGLAKSGSDEPNADYNPAELGLSDRVGSGRSRDGRQAGLLQQPGGECRPAVGSYSQNPMPGTPMTVVLCVWVLTPNMIRPPLCGRLGVVTKVS
jgi:hypothetical protein